MTTQHPSTPPSPASGSVSAGQAAAFIVERFGAGIGPVVPLRQGGWSTAYAFRRAGADYVIRFGTHVEDYEKDRLASRFASRDLPIPAVTEIGEALGGFYAISEKVPGGFLDDLGGAQMRALLPSLFAALDAAHRVDLSATSGYGGWSADGHGSCASWRAYLLDVATDRPTARVRGWRARMDASPAGSWMFDEAFACLRELVDDVPEERCLIHSDLLNYNVLVSGNTLSGVIDWGCSLYGDFLYDIAWLAFLAPRFPAWEGIDFPREAARHYASIGLDVPCFAERLRCYMIHIGLGDQGYNAYMGRWDEVEAAARHTLAIARGEI